MFELITSADQQKTNRSTLIRSAVEEKLERIEKEGVALQLQAGYLEMASLRSADNAELADLTTEEDPEILALCKSIVSSQQAEIDQMVSKLRRMR